MSALPTRAVRIDPWRACAWMLRYPVRRKAGLAAVLGALLAGDAVRVLAPWPLKIIVDSVVGGQPLPAPLGRLSELVPFMSTPQGLLGWCVAATLLLFVAGWVVGLAGAYAGIAFGQRMIYDLAGDVFARLQRLSLRFHGSRSLGDLIRRVTDDCGSVATIVRDALLPLVSSVAMLVAMFLIMWALSPQLALLALAVVPLLMLSLRLFAAPMLRRGYEQQSAEAELYSIVERTLWAMPVVQAFSAEPQTSRAFGRGTSAALDAALATTRVQIAFKVAVGLATALGTAGIVAVGSEQVLTGRLSLGELLVFLAYLGSLYAPLNALMYTSSTINMAAGSATRVIEIFDTDREVATAPAAKKVARATGHIRFEQVHFGYDADRPVLRGITLDVPPGSTVAVVGASGAGKSTLAALIPRFFDPVRGRILLDGDDLRTLDLSSLRQQVAVVLQESFLFPLTIAENIAYASPGATRERIEAAARAAGAEEFIRRLPRGYDTVVGERGATLSGGERQRIAIARALLKDAPILVLDEPTAALDAATEAGLLQALKVLMRGRTSIVIAHRLSTVRDADFIVVLDKGRIVESGRHLELLAAQGIYDQLHRHQFVGSRE
jgi:ATP-binding cassette, subfamily B, bacterial